jgi:hypothetical protein
VQSFLPHEWYVNIASLRMGGRWEGNIEGVGVGFASESFLGQKAFLRNRLPIRRRSDVVRRGRSEVLDVDCAEPHERFFEPFLQGHGGLPVEMLFG